MNKNRAFTLIELLVVIAIIGVLSSVVLASLNTAREKAANARRQSDMRQIQNALELYALANGGNYPAIGNANTCTPSTWTALETVLAPYIGKLPVDPAPDCSISRMYYVLNYTTTDYKVVVHMPPNGASAPRSIWDPARDNGSNAATVDGGSPWAWAVYTPGGATN